MLVQRLGTGKEQSIKIESQTAFSEDEIKQKSQKQRSLQKKTSVEKRVLRFEIKQIASSTKPDAQSKKQKKKLDENDIAPILTKVDELEALFGIDDGPIADDDLDEAGIQAKVKELEEAMHGISAKLYEAAAAAMETENTSDSPAEDGVVDANFEVVDEED